MRIYKDFFFEAAHYLPDAQKGHPDASADASADARVNARIHGHSFRARVTVEGEPDPQSGTIVDFDVLQAAIEQAREELDHRFLNEVEGLDQPTLERIAQWLWARLAGPVPGLAEIVIARDSCFEGCVYNGEPAAAPKARGPAPRRAAAE